MGHLLLHTLPAVAVCPKPDPKVCGEFFKSDAVFVGTVLSERIDGGDYNSITGWTYGLRVERVFRGPSLKTIAVFTANDSARYLLELGRQYLLFASHEGGGQWVIGGCGNSGLLSDVKTKIREIEDVRKSTSGAIESRVGLNTGLGGIRVVVHGSGKTFAAVTDRNGLFRMTVPPGRYSAKIETSRAHVFDLSYDDPSDFIVPKGGCAQLQFTADMN